MIKILSPKFNTFSNTILFGFKSLDWNKINLMQKHRPETFSGWEEETNFLCGYSILYSWNCIIIYDNVSWLPWRGNHAARFNYNYRGLVPRKLLSSIFTAHFVVHEHMFKMAIKTYDTSSTFKVCILKSRHLLLTWFVYLRDNVKLT